MNKSNAALNEFKTIALGTLLAAGLTARADVDIGSAGTIHANPGSSSSFILPVTLGNPPLSYIYQGPISTTASSPFATITVTLVDENGVAYAPGDRVTYGNYKEVVNYTLDPNITGNASLNTGLEFRGSGDADPTSYPSSTAFDINLTPTPEPDQMLAGSLILGGGALACRRRRRLKATAV